MTLEEIHRSSPEFRTKLGTLVKGKEMQILLSALEKNVLKNISRDPVLKPGQSYTEAVSNAHSYLQGMRDVIDTIQTIGDDKPAHTPAPQEVPYDHAVPEHLKPENWGKHPFIQGTTQKK